MVPTNKNIFDPLSIFYNLNSIVNVYINALHEYMKYCKSLVRSNICPMISCLVITSFFWVDFHDLFVLNLYFVQVLFQLEHPHQA